MAILLPPAEGSIAPWRDLRQPCVPGCFSGHCDLGRSCPALRLMFYSTITSWRSQPCVRRCSSAPCVPPKAALRLISGVRDFFPPSHVRSELSLFFPGSYKLYKHSGHFQLRSSGSHCEAKISSLCRASSTGTRKFLIWPITSSRDVSSVVFFFLAKAVHLR